MMRPILCLAIMMCATVGVVWLAEADERTYVGAETCEKCHHVQHISWRKGKHGKAFESLQPGRRAEVKRQAGLDPGKDYTHDARCLGCHTTGYGKPGGFVSLDETPHRVDVQCESCHGAGSDYVDEVMRRKFSFAHAEVRDRGHIGYAVRAHAHSEASAPSDKPEHAHDTGSHGHHRAQAQADTYGYTALGDPPPYAHRHQGKILPLDADAASYCMEACHNDKSPTHAVSGIKNFRETFTRQVKKGVHRRYGLMFIHW